MTKEVMKKIFTGVFLMTISTSLLAQDPTIRYVSMEELLPYILPFYLVTMISLGLFIQKVIKPSFPTKWLYLSTVIGILGAVIMAYQFRDFRTRKLTDKQIERKMEKRSIARQEKEEQNELVGNFWRIAIPNVILLGIGVALDYRGRQLTEENKFIKK